MRYSSVGVQACVLAVCLQGTALAQDRPALAAINVGVQSGLTLARRAVEGKVRGWRDVWRTLGWGAVSGAGFHGAKAFAGSGNLTAGWMVANVSASVSENTAAGLHPLAQIGYSIGPVRFRVPIPAFQDDADAHVYMDVSAYQVVALAGARLLHEGSTFKGGAIVFERGAPYRFDTDDDLGHICGAAAGMFPGVWTAAPAATCGRVAATWNHEFVHAIQSLQFDAVEPALPWLFNDRDEAGRPARKAWLRFEQVKIGLVNIPEELVEVLAFPYRRQWREIEAFRLAEDTPASAGR